MNSQARLTPMCVMCVASCTATPTHPTIAHANAVSVVHPKCLHTNRNNCR